MSTQNLYNDNRDLPVKIKGYPSINKKVKRMAKVMSNMYYPDRYPKVVDIGTRNGYGVEALNNLGYHAIGTELMAEWVEFAQKKGRNVIFDDFMETKLKKEFNIVFSRHCLEHCRDTVQFFNSCAKILKPGGIVFVSFPLEKHKKYEEKLGQTYHMVCYETLEEFRAVPKPFKEVYLGLSKYVGIKPSDEEALFIGELNE